MLPRPDRNFNDLSQKLDLKCFPELLPRLGRKTSSTASTLVEDVTLAMCVEHSQ